MKLLFVGDVMLGRLVNQALKARPPEYPWGNTLDVFRSVLGIIAPMMCGILQPGKVLAFPDRGLIDIERVRCVSLGDAPPLWALPVRVPVAAYRRRIVRRMDSAGLRIPAPRDVARHDPKRAGVASVSLASTIISSTS